MDDMKLFAKTGKELKNLIQTIRLYSHDTGMEFNIEKCTMLKMKSERRESIKDIELQNQERIKTLREKDDFKE